MDEMTPNEKHILDERTSNLSGNKVSFCGTKLHSYNWYFQSAGHAISSIQDGATTIPCRWCKSKIVDLLNSIEDPDDPDDDIPERVVW